ncbi:MAG: chemotaxis protein CheW [Planctomycetota bacterium]
MDNDTAATTPDTAASAGGKYLTFALGNEGYGLEILMVREIIKYMDITHVPRTPEYVRGVINLRGQVISVVDLRAKFSMPSAEATDETCIIVVECGGKDGQPKVTTGVIVDRVSEVLSIADEQIEPAPPLGSGVRGDYILGMGKVGQQVKILLDIDRVLDGGLAAEAATGDPFAEAA